MVEREAEEEVEIEVEENTLDKKLPSKCRQSLGRTSPAVFFLFFYFLRFLSFVAAKIYFYFRLLKLEGSFLY